MKYRKRPVVIEAFQWFQLGDHSHVLPLHTATPVNLENLECNHCHRKMAGHGNVVTLEGSHIVCPGDWIIKGKGEFYPCKPDIFEMTYDPVETGK